MNPELALAYLLCHEYADYVAVILFENKGEMPISKFRAIDNLLLYADRELYEIVDDDTVRLTVNGNLRVRGLIAKGIDKAAELRELTVR